MLRKHTKNFVQLVKEEYSHLQFTSALLAGCVGMTIGMRAAIDLNHPLYSSAKKAGLSKHRILKLRSRKAKVKTMSRAANTLFRPTLTAVPTYYNEVFNSVSGSRKDLVLPTVLEKRNQQVAGSVRVPIWEPGVSLRA